MEKRAIQIASPVIGEDEWQSIRAPVFSGWLTQGIRVRSFKNFVKHVLG
jgi:dTDP-4-amino-4,6-dideoxygalactose transaminase